MKNPTNMEDLYPINQIKILYPIYIEIHRLCKLHPDIFNFSRCNKVLTHLMAGHNWSWHVVGITELALNKFKEQNFKYTVNSKITRAHIIPRIDTVTKILKNSSPLNQDEFSRVWIENDKTVLCSKGENKKIVPNYIKIDNSDYNLFQSTFVSWRHSNVEEKYLEYLYKQMKS